MIGHSRSLQGNNSKQNKGEREGSISPQKLEGVNTSGPGKPVDNCRDSSCKTPQLESCHELRALGGGKRVDNVCNKKCVSTERLLSPRTLYSTSADGTSASWGADLA